MNNPEILIIDDEVQIQKLLEITLQSHDYNVIHAVTAKDGLIAAACHPPDLIILDLGLPDENGQMVLKKLREWYSRPIIILTVQSKEEDIIMALDNGANDYLVKPFRTGELLARIRSALRSKIQIDSIQILDFDNLQVDLAARMVKKDNEQIKLTATEYSLLVYFAKNEGRVLTHQYLLREVWGPGYINQTQYLRVFVAQLRKKIERDPDRPVHLLTESGVGYRFVSKE